MKLQAIFSVQKTDEKGNIIFVNPGETFTVDDKEGARLVELGAACTPTAAAQFVVPKQETVDYSGDTVEEDDLAEEGDGTDETLTEEESDEEEGSDETDFEAMDKKAAKKYAKEIGVTVKSDDNLDDIIAKIKAKLAEEDE